MYLLKNNKSIVGILIFEVINKMCKIYVIDLYFDVDSNSISIEFIYFIGDYFVNNFNKLIFCNINNYILKKIYHLVLKYVKYRICNLDNEITDNFENINITDIYIFDKYIEEKRDNCCIFILYLILIIYF